LTNADASREPRVDAHHHLWRLDRGDYGWLTPELAAIYRDFTLADLLPLLRDARIEATVLVQAAPTIAETRFLLDIARASGGVVRGVVGWLDMCAPDAVSTLTRLARDPLLKSIRPMLQDLPDPAWILRADARPVLEALPRLGLAFDALVKPAQLPALLEMVRRLPDLDVVIDHGGKPAIVAGDWEPWADLMTSLAAHPRVVCKLSGLATEAGHGWSPHRLRCHVEHLIKCFGPYRLLWGSDWPVVDLGGGYRRWVAATDELLSDLSPVDRAAILGGNAWRIYRLE